VVGGLPFVKGKMTFAVVAVHEGRPLSCRSGRRLGEKILHRVPEQVSIVAEICGVRRLRQDHELTIAVRELAEEVEQVVGALVAQSTSFRVQAALKHVPAGGTMASRLWLHSRSAVRRGGTKYEIRP
jgi:hypothetical protein